MDYKPRYPEIYMEVNEDWIPYINRCLDDIYLFLNGQKIDIDLFTIDQIKEKFSELRLYYSFDFEGTLGYNNRCKVERIIDSYIDLYANKIYLMEQNKTKENRNYADEKKY